MPNFTCTDINGNSVNQFSYGQDGIIYGVNPNGGTNVSISPTCCDSLGYTFDPNDGVCYWQKPCDTDQIKVLISPEGTDGVIYETADNETCHLEIEFDYLLEFNCKKILACKDGLDAQAQQAAAISMLIDDKYLEYDSNGQQVKFIKSELVAFLDYTNIQITELEADIKYASDKITSNKAIILKNEKAIAFTKNPILLAEFQAANVVLELENETLAGTIEDMRQMINELNEETVTYKSSVESSMSELHQANDVLLGEIAALRVDLNGLQLAMSGNNILGLISGVNVSASLEAWLPVAPISESESFEITYMNNTVVSDVLYDWPNALDFFAPNNGVYFQSNDSSCQALISIITQELGNNASLLNENTFNSYWLHHKMVIDDPAMLAMIAGQRIKLGILIDNNPCEFAVLLDNIRFNKICEVTNVEQTVLTECPSFNLRRTVDNKKSWVAKEVFEDREFDLKLRETGYDINHHKLAINSKEVDINLDAAAAIESDYITFALDNPCVIAAFTGVMSTSIFQEGLSIDEIREILYSEMIDVKDRQTIRDYPLLRAIYDAYLYGAIKCNAASSQFTYYTINGFIDLVGRYWVDLIEQVVPSTTIWGSTYKYSNTIFDNCKFKYRKSSLYTCTPQGNLPKPVLGTQSGLGIETTLTQVIGTESITTTGACDTLFVVQTCDGSEFIGSVNVVGTTILDGVASGDVIILSESDDSARQKLT